MTLLSLEEEGESSKSKGHTSARQLDSGMHDDGKMLWKTSACFSGTMEVVDVRVVNYGANAGLSKSP
jgi:hypothetical protein